MDKKILKEWGAEVDFQTFNAENKEEAVKKFKDFLRGIVSLPDKDFLEYAIVFSMKLTEATE